jgi:alpha-glucosidase
MLMVLALRGTPFLYYGEELAMADGRIRPDRVVDVAGRDPERTPMPWDSSPGAGFTTGRPWLPIGAEARDGINVADELADPDSMLAFTRRVIALRRASAALRAGSYRRVAAERGVFAFVREAPAGDEGGGQPAERKLVVLEFEGRGRSLDLRAALGAGASGEPGGSASLLVSTSGERAPGEIDLGKLELGADEGLVATLP